jgi:hypothetical protein
VIFSQSDRCLDRVKPAGGARRSVKTPSHPECIGQSAVACCREEVPRVLPELLKWWRQPGLLIVASLLAIVLLAHGASLFDGLFFDDYWHRGTLQNSGWTWHDMIEWTTFDLPGPLNHLWWQTHPLQWRYVRPLAMVEMKLEYLTSGCNPVALHAFGLAWHWLTALLVYRLASWAIASRKWAFVAAALFVINPHSVIGVSWIAARNAQISTFFFLAATLAYAAASVPRESGPLRRGMFAWTLLLWALALLSREAAVAFPLVALALDASFGGRGQLRHRWSAHGLMWALALLYVGWRLILFPQTGAPELYFHTPDGLSYVAWATSKMLQMVFSLTFSTPMFLGLAGSDRTTGDTILLHAVMVMGILGLATWYAIGSRGVHGRWFWPIWVVAAFLPVVPVFILPHFAYLSVVGYAVMLAVLLSRLRGWPQVVVTSLVFACAIAPLCAYRFAWRGIVRSEQIVYQDMVDSAPPAQPGSTIFLINWPIIGMNAPSAARHAWGTRDLEGYVLTFAPQTLRMTQPGSVEVLNHYELLVSVQGSGYFSGSTGRLLLDLTRAGAALPPQAVVHGEAFDASVVQADAAGVTKIKLTFPKPLDSDEYRFYVSSPTRPAQRLEFHLADNVRSAEDPAAQAWRERNREILAESDYYFDVINVLRRIVRTDLLLTRDSR